MLLLLISSSILTDDELVAAHSAHATDLLEWNLDGTREALVVFRVLPINKQLRLVDQQPATENNMAASINLETKVLQSAKQ